MALALSYYFLVENSMRGQPKFLDPNLATLPILGHNALLSGSLKWHVFANSKTSAASNCPLELFVSFYYCVTKT